MTTAYADRHSVPLRVPSLTFDLTLSADPLTGQRSLVRVRLLGVHPKLYEETMVQRAVFRVVDTLHGPPQLLGSTFGWDVADVNFMVERGTLSPVGV